MSFNFEKFEAVGSSFAPKVTIRSNGSIGFSQGAINRFDLKDGDWFACLFYDRNQKVIGIQPTRDSTAKGAAPLIKRETTMKNGKTSLNSFISAKPFMDFYGISYEEARTFHAEPYQDASGEMILIKLSEESSNQSSSHESEAEGAAI